MKKSIKEFLLSFKYAFTGIFETIKSERNIKLHILIMILVIIFGILLKITKIEWMICIILFSIVIASELLNTAIENTVDLISEEKSELARKAKDAAAGAVLAVSIGSAIIGLMIFIPKIQF